MTKAFVTFAIGKYAAFLDIARPSFAAYAERHGYDYIEVGEADSVLDASRPPSWSKVPVLLRALETHDAALWVDCDAVIVDGTEDIAAHVPSEAWQGMTLHHTHRGFDMGELPSCGTWFVRVAMIPVLQQAWGMTHYIDTMWWEQAAMHELLGYVRNGDAVFPVRRGEETELRRNTHFLPYDWAHTEFTDIHAQPRVMHVPTTMPFETRVAMMQYWANRATVRVISR
jgi:hypothetical protein